MLIQYVSQNVVPVDQVFELTSLQPTLLLDLACMPLIVNVSG